MPGATRTVKKYVFELDNGYGDGGLQLESSTPFMPVSRGDLINPAWFSAYGFVHPGRGIIYEALKVEHILYPLDDDSLCHQMVIIVKEVVDDQKTRVERTGEPVKLGSP
ncbi:hypothetical protein ABS71_20320 [bacterium SCN 62-11]|nr:MAG: hypothetical protein ABS71_20320 [bacterium SCN 62-11]